MSYAMNERSVRRRSLLKKGDGVHGHLQRSENAGYSKWHELSNNHENPMDAEERYDELLKLADEYCSRAFINSSERITLIEVATTAYTRSIAESEIGQTVGYSRLTEHASLNPANHDGYPWVDSKTCFVLTDFACGFCDHQ